MYKKIDDGLQYAFASSAKQKKTLDDIIIAVKLNLALAYLKLGDGPNCTEECKKVLERDASNEKALFRLGQVVFVVIPIDILGLSVAKRS